jgi:flavin-dependent dehydrogenase
MKPNDTARPDVVVIGGGPAGCTASTLIAEKGYRVRLFEREHFPRYHIGESLIPCTYHVIRRLNLLERMKGSHFVKKYSVQFVNQHGKLSEPFYFVEHKAHESSQTWQVKREEFDKLLIDNARAHGVDVHEGVRVQHPDGREEEVRAQVVVDASGQGTMIMSRMGLRDWDPILKKAALWTYWEGAFRDTGRDEGATLVMQTRGKHGWFWYIPLHESVVSVGVVAAYDYLFKNGREAKGHEEIYFEEVDRCPGLKGRLVGARRAGPFRAAKEYSYRSRRAAGDGWVLVGDAFGFLDPLYSSGVLLALTSGSMAADAVTEGLAKGDTSAAQLGMWESDFVKGMDRMRNLVVAYYEGLSFGRFVRKHPHLKGLVTDVLIGDLFDRDDVDVLWPLMDEMLVEQRAAEAATSS